MSVLALENRASTQTDRLPRGRIDLKRPGQLERLATMATLFFLSCAVPTTWFREGTAGFVAVQVSDPVTQLVFAGLYGFLLSRLLGNEGQLIRAVRIEPLLFSWVGFALLSVLWSADTGRTINVSVIFLLTTLIAVYLFIRYELVELVWMLFWVSLAAVAVNLVWALGLPAYGDSVQGWQGVHTDKNSLGRAAVFDFVILLMSARLFRRFRVVAYGGAAAAAVLVFGSTSGTSRGSLAAMVGFLVIFQAFRGRRTLYGAVAISYLVATGIGIYIGLTRLEVIAGLVGKDASMTGRTRLWELVLAEVPNRPLFGAGFAAFWTDWFGPAHEIWISFAGERLPHAHNALLQYLLELGMIGAGMFLLLYVRGVVRATRYVRDTPGVLGLWPIMILSFTLMYSLTEVGVQGRNIFWVSFIYALLTVGRHTGRLKAAAAASGRSGFLARHRLPVPRSPL